MTAVSVQVLVPLPRGPLPPRPASTPSAGSTTYDLRPTRRPAVDLEVVVPAYNEALRLPTTLATTVAYLAQQPWTSRVVVVDNGSSDDTARVIAVARRPVRAGAGRRDRLRAGGQGRRGPPRPAHQRVAVRRLLRRRPLHARGDARHRHGALEDGAAAVDRLAVRPRLDAAAPAAARTPARRCRLPQVDPPAGPGHLRHPVRVQVLRPRRGRGRSPSAAPRDSPSTSSCCGGSRTTAAHRRDPRRLDRRPASTFRPVPDGLASFAALFQLGARVTDGVRGTAPPHWPRSPGSPDCGCWS